MNVFPEGVRFVPFAIDSHGKWGEAFKAYVRELCEQKAEGLRHTPLYASVLARITRRISIAHARAVGNRLVKGHQAIMTRAKASGDHKIIQNNSYRGIYYR